MSEFDKTINWADKCLSKTAQAASAASTNTYTMIWVIAGIIVFLLFIWWILSAYSTPNSSDEDDGGDEDGDGEGDGDGDGDGDGEGSIIESMNNANKTGNKIATSQK